MNANRHPMLRVSRTRPCPVCDSASWCLRSEAGDVALCMRQADGGKPIKLKDGTVAYLHKPSDWRDDRQTYIRPAPAPRPYFDWQAEAERFFRHADATVKRAELADSLGVNIAAIAELRSGWDGAAHTFPERNGRGEIIGLARRFPNGAKYMTKGSARGLTFACPTWDWGGPVLLVEGASDTAAGLTMGLSVVGRPSCRGGGPLLVELLRGIGRRQIIVIAERDFKPGKCPTTCIGCPRCWPGLHGARWLAHELRQAGLAAIHELCPDGAKDLRAWLNSHNRLDAEAAGKLFVERITQPTIPDCVRRANEHAAEHRRRKFSGVQA
jgi:hypothetical protein